MLMWPWSQLEERAQTFTETISLNRPGEFGDSIRTRAIHRSRARRFAVRRWLTTGPTTGRGIVASGVETDFRDGHLRHDYLAKSQGSEQGVRCLKCGPRSRCRCQGLMFASIVFATRSASRFAQLGSLLPGVAFTLGVVQVRASTTTFSCTPNAC
jgi:hypothetical protein